MATISELVRKAIDAANISRYAIAKQTGIDQSALSRFMSGERGLRLEALDKIGELLALNLAPAAGTPPPQPKAPEDTKRRDEPEPTPEQRAKSKAVFLANEAIDALKRIPKNDCLRKRGFEIVTDWIRIRLENG